MRSKPLSIATSLLNILCPCENGHHKDTVNALSFRSDSLMNYCALIHVSLQSTTNDAGCFMMLTLCFKADGVFILTHSASYDNWCTGRLLNRIITAQWEGMVDVESARYEPALLPPRPTIRVLSYSNCQRSTHSIKVTLQKFSTLRVIITSLSNRKYCAKQ